MSIGFLQIQPFRTNSTQIEFDNSRAFGGTVALPKKILLVGQRLSTGTVAAETLVTITGENDGDKFHGLNSMIADMCRAAKRNNKTAEIKSISLADNGGATQATGSFDISGTTTEAGAAVLEVAGIRFSAALASGSNAAAAETAIVAAAQAVTRIPCTFAPDGAADGVDVTARNGGTLGNLIDIRVISLPPGLAITVNGTGTDLQGYLSGGATDPTFQDALDALSATEHFDTIVCPYVDATSLTAAENDMAGRWDPTRGDRGLVFSASALTAAGLTTLGNSRNSEHLVIVEVAKSPTPPWVIAAAAAAAEASFTSPAAPRQGKLLIDVVAPDDADVLDQPTRNTLLFDGIATTKVVGGKVLIERLITTYQTDPQSVPDPSYLDSTTMRINAKMAGDVETKFSPFNNGYVLASDGTDFPDGARVMTPKYARTLFIELGEQWISEAIMEDLDGFIDGLIVEVNASNPSRLDFRITPDHTSGFRGLAGQVQFRI